MFLLQTLLDTILSSGIPKRSTCTISKSMSILWDNFLFKNSMDNLSLNHSLNIEILKVYQIYPLELQSSHLIPTPSIPGQEMLLSEDLRLPTSMMLSFQNHAIKVTKLPNVPKTSSLKTFIPFTP